MPTKRKTVRESAQILRPMVNFIVNSGGVRRERPGENIGGREERLEGRGWAG
jgi:hypothetical protein